MSGVLLDTCIIIDVLRGRPNALTWLKLQTGSLYLCTTSICEIRAGERGMREKAQFDRLLQHFIMVSIDAEVAEQAGALLKRYARSHGVGLGDAQIAAAAMAATTHLATLNLKHFPMFPHLTAPY